MNTLLYSGLCKAVPMHNGNPSNDECVAHTVAIENLAKDLYNYLGEFDVAGLVQELAKLYKEAYSADRDNKLDEPDERLLNYIDED